VHCNIMIFLFFAFIVSSVEEAAKASPHYPKGDQEEVFVKEIQKLEEESLQKKNAVLEDSAFQNFVTTLQNQVPLQTMSYNESGDLYIFVSFSLGEKALLNLAIDAKRYGATLVLRGFIDGSYAKTAKALQKVIQKANQGFIIDPELFTLFAVTAVPTYVLTKPFPLTALERLQTPLHDRLQGHVSVQYALETFAPQGDCKAEAQFLLENRGER